MDLGILELGSNPIQQRQDIFPLPSRHVAQRAHRERLDASEHDLEIVDANVLHGGVLGPVAPWDLDAAVVNIGEPNLLEPLLDVGAGGVLQRWAVSHSVNLT